MKYKKGAATLYIIIGVIIFLEVMTYVFTSTSNMQIGILSYFNNIKGEYKTYTTDEEKQAVIRRLENDAQVQLMND